MGKKNNVKVTITDGLKNDLKDFSKQLCSRAADFARETLTTAAYEAFERFYCDYAPFPSGLYTSYHFKYYKPTGNPFYYDRTYNILRNGIKGFKEDKHGKIIRGGVQINPDWLEDVYKDATPQFVFETIYEDGWHGVPGNGVPNMSPTPQEYLLRNYNSLCSRAIDLFVYDEIDSILKDGNFEYLQ